MRAVDRLYYNDTKYWQSPTFQHLESEVNKFLRNKSKLRPPKVIEYLKNNLELREDLNQTFLGKCAYCEIKLHTKTYHIDLFRPSGAQITDLQYERLHYVWLSYVWENIYLSCGRCAQIKAQHFPIQGTLGEIKASIEDLNAVERPVLIDPCVDDPEIHFRVHVDGRVVGITDRGVGTVELLDLNDRYLVSSRRSSIEEAFDKWRSVLNKTPFASDRRSALSGLFSDRREFSGIRYLLFKSFFSSRESVPDLERLVRIMAECTLVELNACENLSIDYSSIGRPDDFSHHRFEKRIQSASIVQFKGLKKLKINFPDSYGKGASCYAFVGKNSAGKTSLLQAICLGFLGEERLSALGRSSQRDLKSFIQYERQSFKIKLNFADGTENHLLCTQRTGTLGDSTVRPIVLAYGAFRMIAKAIPKKERRTDKFVDDVRVNSLFDESARTRDPIESIRKIKDEAKRISAIGALSEIFKAFDGELKIGKKNQIYFYRAGARIPLKDLSSGYKSILCIVGDLIDAIFKKDGVTETARAVVLIDEIDAHLHPSWRLKIVSALRSAFPYVQFWISTHDPLVLRGLGDHEIFILNEKDPDGQLKSNQEPVSKLDVDQILTSDLFEMTSTLSPELSELFREYYAILRKPELDKSKLTAIEDDLSRRNQLGQTKRERIFYQAIDSYLAKHEFKIAKNISREFIESVVDSLDQDGVVGD